VVHSSAGTIEGAILESPAPAQRVSLRAGVAGIEVLRCNQCDEPLCVFSCKSGALYRHPSSGRISLDEQQCVACWMCVMVCPHGIRPDTARDVAARCDVCAGREVPACVQACPTHTLRVKEEGPARVVSDFDGRVVVVGSSAAGIAACEAVRERAPSASITMVTADRSPSYSRPLLAYLLSGHIPAERITWRDETHLSETLGVEVLRGVRVTGLDPERKKLRLADRAELDYDRLIIATGARAAMPDMPGIRKEGVCGLRDLEDAEEISRATGPGKQAVVLGGGNVGLQTCEALLARGMDTTVVVRSAHLLSQMVDGEAGRRVAALFEQHGLTVRTGRDVVEILGEERVSGVRLDSGEELGADLVVVGKSIRPNVEWLQHSGVKVDWGIRVDCCGRTNVEGVFAAGDCAEMPDPLTGRHAVSGVWPVAYETGFSAGSTAVGIPRQAPGALRMNASRFFGVPIISIGEVRDQQLDGAQVRILANSDGVYRKLVYKGGVLFGALLYNDISGAGTFYRLYRQSTKLDETVLREVDDREVERVLAPLVMASEGA
jgi:NAD(P)H-nitrite reductase large subunit/Pyruvate/2-oxoacid:ferredoxin oxidoreductase delta subunit